MIKDSNVVDSTKLDDNKVIIIRNSFSNPLGLTLFMHNVEKWPNILLKSCGFYSGPVSVW